MLHNIIPNEYVNNCGSMNNTTNKIKHKKVLDQFKKHPAHVIYDSFFGKNFCSSNIRIILT